jgi:uncharacterized protein YndB with AHSA1/START domain
VTQKGFLIIADITGYTEFLSGSELEHAQDSLRSLLNLLIEHTEPPMVISRLEGDAVISYVSEGSFLQGQTLLESLEKTYVAFRLAQQRMRINTTCTCMACQNIPNLDLKFFVHFGEYMLQQLGPYTELIGNDVNLVHRIVKNSITETHGCRAYAAYTSMAIDALEINDLKETLSLHSEPDPYLGELQLYVQNLQPVWDRERDRQRISVDPAEGLFTIEEDYPIGPALLWDYLTKPEYRAILNNADAMGLEQTQSGRTGTGSVYICAHGEQAIEHAVIDWRPFEYYTYESSGALPNTCNHVTIFLEPNDGGTRVVGVCSHTIGSEPAAKENDAIVLENVPTFAQQGCQALLDRVQRDLELGIIFQPATPSIDGGAVEQAVHAALSPATG